MKKGEEYLWTLWGIITIVAILHLVRAISGWTVVVESFVIPVWFSYLTFIIIGVLSYKLFKHLKK
tara:strand:- start:175 stop:369 length:195 start_codon:yes stop_codon:yes gene_type:complete